MNGDISLSQTLGGLRIANPDDASTSPSPPVPMAGATRPPPPPPASDSSTSTLRDIHQRFVPLSQPAEQPLAPVLTTTLSASNVTPNSSGFFAAAPAPSTPSQADYQSRLNHRQSMPLAHQAQQQLQFPLQSPPATQPRNYPLDPSRPMSNIYNHPNLSSSSQTSTYNAYRYGDEPPQPSILPMKRSSSRAAPTSMSGSGMITRDLSRSDHSLQSQQIQSTINGPAPPRRSSRRIPASSMPPTGIPLGSSPYGMDTGLMSSSEEWKEKGAAVGVRKEIDVNGRPIQKVLKKGVKDFNFGRTLGEGSYSTVLAATDRQTLREYAIKVLDKRHIIKEKKVKYVNIEKDTLNRLTDHPGIVRLYYTFQDERSLYFVLDLASNGELLGVLKKMGTFDEECTCFYGAQILDAIGYMHSKGVIHRDLKPENVLLDTQMNVKITDFGTAKLLDIRPRTNGGAMSGDPTDGANMDRAMSFVGTAEYVSPELLTDKNACKASDLWAFGCIIYQLIAGRPPFKAGNEYQTFQKIVALDYTFPDGFPAIARDLVERLLVLDPVKRLSIEHVRNHPFFEGIVWGKDLWKQKAPRLKAYTAASQAPISLNASSSTHIVTANNVPRSSARIITELPPPSQLDIDWSPVLTRNNERILKLGNLMVTSAAQPHSPNSKAVEGPSETPKKFSRFFGGGGTTKKRQRLVIITSSARIIIAAAGGDEKKAKMDISLLGQGSVWKSYKDSRGLTCWCVDTKDKHLVFEDPKATTADPEGSKWAAQEWMEMLDGAHDFALSHSISTSYSSDSALNDLSSTLSSPDSTLDEDTALDGVNIPTTRLRRGLEGDNESMKGRKRFSRRHSKNGLAAVF